MRNEIEEVREAIDRALATARVVEGERLVETSPCGRYRVVVDSYASAAFPDRSSYAVAEVSRTSDGGLIATVKKDDDQWFHGWATREGRDYLLCAESLEGHTVVDLTSGRVAGYAEKDEFIWTNFYPSPDGSKVAIMGCYWACPFEVVVYDFAEPMNVPLPGIERFLMPRADDSFDGWTSPTAFRLIGTDGGVHTFELGATSPDKPM